MIITGSVRRYEIYLRYERLVAAQFCEILWPVIYQYQNNQKDQSDELLIICLLHAGFLRSSLAISVGLAPQLLEKYRLG